MHGMITNSGKTITYFFFRFERLFYCTIWLCRQY